MSKKVIKVKQNVVADGIAGGGLNDLFLRSAQLQANTEPETFGMMCTTAIESASTSQPQETPYMSDRAENIIYGAHILSLLFLGGVIVFHLK